MKKFLKDNSLSIVFLLLFIISLAGQIFTGYKVYIDELLDDGGSVIPLGKYLTSGHFLQSTFENWESEFLQMAVYIVLTISLRQVGSSESKKPGEKEEVDRKPDPKRPDVPWAVKKGGIILKLYENSLSIIFFLLFILSWMLHFAGSIKDENLFRLLNGKSQLDVAEYILNSRLWFESFQNWQSEFLSVFAIVILSIFLRQRGSSQSKPVDAPNSQTGD